LTVPRLQLPSSYKFVRMNKIYETFITDTGAEPVTLEQLKTFCRVTSYDDDDLLTELITIARKKIERYTLLSLVDKTIVLTGCLDSMFLLPWPNISEVTGVRYLEGQISTTGDNDWEDLDDDDYQLIGYHHKHFNPHLNGTHEITYTTTANTDSGLKHDLKRVALWLFENLGDDSDNMPVELMSNSKHLRLLNFL
jgi:uncharacterized phiE125 gp8 family phage protein